MINFVLLFQLAVLFAIVGVSIAASVSGSNPDAAAEVVKSELDNIGVEDFKYRFKPSFKFPWIQVQ